MSRCGEGCLLKEYVQTLQAQIQAKSVEQKTLYSTLQMYQQQLQKMDEMHRERVELIRQNKILKQQIQGERNRQRQIIEAVAQLQQSHCQILMMRSTIQTLQQKMQNTQQSQAQLHQQNMNLKQQLKETKEKQQQAKLHTNHTKQQLSIQTLKNKELLDQLKIKDVQMNELQQKLQELGHNYMEVQAAIQQKEQDIINLLQEIQMLKKNNEQFMFELHQKNIMIDCLQDQLQEFQKIQKPVISQPTQPNMLEAINKLDLIRHNNQLVQKVHFLQKQNRGVQPQTPHENSIKMLDQLQLLKSEFEQLNRKLMI